MIILVNQILHKLFGIFRLLFKSKGSSHLYEKPNKIKKMCFYISGTLKSLMTYSNTRYQYHPTPTTLLNLDICSEVSGWQQSKEKVATTCTFWCLVLSPKPAVQHYYLGQEFFGYPQGYVVKILSAQGFFEKLLLRGLVTRDSTDFEDICIMPYAPAKTTAVLYNLLLTANPDRPPTYIRNWERDLGCSLSEAELNKIFALTPSMSTSAVGQEQSFKILSCWYRCPATLRAMFPSSADVCWRCGLGRGTMFHICWACPSLQPFSEQVFDLYDHIMDVQTPRTPEVALLSLIPGSISGIKKVLQRFFLLAARNLIPRQWKSREGPSILEWVRDIVT